MISFIFHSKYIFNVFDENVIAITDIFKKWRRKWQPSPVFLLGKSHGQRSLVSYNSQGCKESDMTEQLHSLFKKRRVQLHSISVYYVK